MELCPRALEVLKRHLTLRARLKLAGKIDHDDLFFKETGEPIRNLQYAWVRWRRSLQLTLKARYREPYNARHSSVSWNLMIGKNPLWVAKQHGHSVQTMLEVYAAWTEGTKETDIDAIRKAMERRPALISARAANDVPGVEAATSIGAGLAHEPRPPRSPRICHQNATRKGVARAKCLTKRKIDWRRERKQYGLVSYWFRKVFSFWRFFIPSISHQQFVAEIAANMG